MMRLGSVATVTANKPREAKSAEALTTYQREQVLRVLGAKTASQQA